MGLKLTVKCLPKYSGRLKKFGVDYRQVDEITFVNTQTGEEKTFEVDRWNEERQIYAVDLVEEKKRKGVKKCSTKKN